MLKSYNSLLSEKVNNDQTENEKKLYIDYANGIRNIGRIYENKGNNDKAIQHYQQAITFILKADSTDSSFLASKL